VVRTAPDVITPTATLSGVLAAHADRDHADRHVDGGHLDGPRR
jgi:hypothetical protein